MFSSSSAFQLRENTGFWELKSAFGCCRFEYVKMMHGDASLWESFPRALERRTGARRYVGAFRAPFQDLRLTPSQEHAVRVCSLLAIPPPPRDQKALPGGVPEDLSEDNLSTWADTVQDVAVGMIVQSAFSWFLPCLDLLPVALLFAYVFPGFLVPRCALLFWGIFVRGLHVETFVRVLRSSRCRLLIKCK